MEVNKIINGDCIEVMKTLPSDSVDAIITDPPYGLEFMGKDWDKFAPSETNKERWDGKRNEMFARDISIPGTGFKQLPTSFSKKQNKKCLKCGHYFYSGTPCKCENPEWEIRENKFNIGFQDFTTNWAKEALRVLKPGGYLLSFGGTRTYHRMTCGIEDAGFEIRDCIMWIYGSGFPKSLNIGKQIDKRGGKYVDWREFQGWLKKHKIESGYTNKEIDEMLGFSTRGGGMFDHFINPAQAQLPRASIYKQMKEILKLPNDFDELIEEAEREITGKDGRGEIKEDMFFHNSDKKTDKTIGYGNWDLKDKPATPEAKEWEGWGTALKPAVEPIVVARKPLSEKNVALNVLKWGTGGINIDESRIGNDKISVHGYQGQGIFGVGGKGSYTTKENGAETKPTYTETNGRFPANDDFEDKTTDDGRTIVSDRPQQRGATNRKNNHPTVKPIKLMEYLIKLVTKKDAVVLDPFLGSGTTGIACVKTNRQFIGIEKESEYVKIAENRIKPYLEQTKLNDL